MIYVIIVNLRFQKEKNFEETLLVQPRQISLYLHLYANYHSLGGFHWRQKRLLFLGTLFILTNKIF